MTGKRLRFGVLGCSEFAGRAMLPAMAETPGIELKAVASRSAAKAREFAARFRCDAVEGYEGLLRRDDIDAVYIPLPPGLHAEWADRALEAGKHLLVEKPFATDAGTAARLVEKARRRRLLVTENFLFPHHSQFAWVRERLASGELGPVALFRTAFTIPPLKPDNFRYDAALGGGARLDLGGYVVRFARAFLGESLTLAGATVRLDRARNIDLSGAAQFVNAAGQVVQAAYGLDAHYQCTWEFLGEKGKLTAERGYTAPPGFSPTVRIDRPAGTETVSLAADNHYRNMCESFSKAVLGAVPFEPYWDEVASQAEYLQQIRDRAVLG